MLRPVLCAALITLLAGRAGEAAAQPAPASSGVEVVQLAAPDAFTTPGRDTGLPATLWAGASLKTVRAVLPLLAARPLTPAGAALARRVLATGAPGPEGARDEPALAAGRAAALTAQGDAKAASATLAHAPGLDRSPELARAAAETALLSGDDPRACRAAAALTTGRDDVYWLRLRTYCQAIGGEVAQAQLTFDLAQSQSRDPVFGRLMGAKLAGGGDPGPPSLRNGLDYALSRSLGLDIAAAKPASAVAAALGPADPTAPAYDPAAAPPEAAPLAEALAKGAPIGEALLGELVTAAGSADPKARSRAQGALLLAAAFIGRLSTDARGQVAALAVPEGKAPLGRALALEAAGQQRLAGEAAMLSLWTLAEAGAAGPGLGDRVRIVRSLWAAGLEADARAIALEGLQALK
jgi:hypothetical protein